MMLKPAADTLQSMKINFTPKSLGELEAKTKWTPTSALYWPIRHNIARH